MNEVGVEFYAVRDYALFPTLSQEYREYIRGRG